MKNIIERIGVFLLAILALGLPVAGAVSLAAFVVVAGIAALGRPSHHPRRVGLALLLAGGIALLAPILRVPAVLRTEQVFLVRNSPADSIYVGSLPPAVFDYMSGQFLGAYGTGKTCPPALGDCWIQAPPVTEAWAFSFDEAWGGRVRSRLAFRDLATGRSGLAGQAAASFEDNGRGVTRAHVPYYVRLVWQKGAVGGTLCWNGKILWEENGRYVVMDDTLMDVSACRMVTEGDVGRSVFGIGLVETRPLGMDFTPARMAGFRNGLAGGLRLGGALAVVLLLTDLASLVALWPQALLLGLGAALIWSRNPDLLLNGGGMLPFGPALRSEMAGRMVARALLSGDVQTVLALDAPAFLEAPGPVLFRAVEKLVFGDGFGGTVVMMLLLLPILFRLARNMMDTVSAWLVVLVFVSGLLGSIGFSANLFYDAAGNGSASALALVVFLGGLALFRPEGAGRLAGGWAAVLMALATLMDPVLLPAALVVLLVGQSEGGVAARFGIYGGILALVPLHNLFFSGMPWPGGTSLFLEPASMSPRVLGQALSGVAREGMAAMAPVLAHARGLMFLGEGRWGSVWAIVRGVVTCAGLFVVVSRRGWLRPLKPVAIGAFAVVVMTVFMVPDISHFMLGGILNVLVVCVLGWHVGVRPARPRYVKPPSAA